MLIKQVMTTNIAPCRPETNLAVVAKLMWNRDYRFVPVVDSAGKVVGVITDRDNSRVCWRHPCADDRTSRPT